MTIDSGNGRAMAPYASQTKEPTGYPLVLLELVSAPPNVLLAFHGRGTAESQVRSRLLPRDTPAWWSPHRHHFPTADATSQPGLWLSLVCIASVPVAIRARIRWFLRHGASTGLESQGWAASKRGQQRTRAEQEDIQGPEAPRNIVCLGWLRLRVRVAMGTSGPCRQYRPALNMNGHLGLPGRHPSSMWSGNRDTAQLHGPRSESGSA